MIPTIEPPKRRFTNNERNGHIRASIFFDKKMRNGSHNNARYNHMMAALAEAAGDKDRTTYHFQNAVLNDPNNVLIRSDYAMQLATQGKYGFKQAQEEYRKALILQEDHPVLRKNYGATLGMSSCSSLLYSTTIIKITLVNILTQSLLPALSIHIFLTFHLPSPCLHCHLQTRTSQTHLHSNKIGKKGDYLGARDHTRRALEINPGDAMAHRNFAAISNQTGDVHTALKHNMRSIHLEKHLPLHSKDSNAYRRAAVQIISTGGDKSRAMALMDTARAIERKRVQLPTTERTNQLLLQMFERRGNAEGELEREAALQKAAQLEEEEALKNGDLGSLLKRAREKQAAKIKEDD